MKKILFVLLFFWISFFAPLTTDYFRFTFLAALFLVLFIQGFINKEVRLRIFNRSELPLLIFLLTMSAGLLFAYKSPIDYKSFLLFILPAPITYFFAKVNFQKNDFEGTAKIIYTMAFLVVVCGLTEFVAKQSLVKEFSQKSMYYLVFLGNRMMSFHQHPTPLGTYLAAIFPLSLILIKRNLRFSLKLLWSIFSLVIFAGIILTFSRGVFLGLLIESCIILVLLAGQKHRKAVLISILLGVLIIAAAALLQNGGLDYFSRLSPEGLTYSRAYSNKIERLIAVINIIKEHPLFGLGFGNFRVFFDKYLPQLANICNYDGKVADCMYLTLLAETGIIGAAGFIIFLYSVFKKSVFSIKSACSSRNRLLVVCFLTGFVGISASFLTYDGLYWASPGYLFWAYAGVLSSLSLEENET